jgi:hypothetical protein
MSLSRIVKILQLNKRVTKHTLQNILWYIKLNQVQLVSEYTFIHASKIIDVSVSCSNHQLIICAMNIRTCSPEAITVTSATLVHRFQAECVTEIETFISVQLYDDKVTKYLVCSY